MLVRLHRFYRPEVQLELLSLGKRVTALHPAVLVGLTCGLWVACLSAWLGQDLAELSLTGRWFQSDGWRAFDDMLFFDASHHRTQVRPWFSLIMIPIAELLGLFGLIGIHSVWAINCLSAGILGALLWSMQRALGASSFAAVATVALFMLSSGTLFWLTVPETFGLGAVAIMLCVWLAARPNTGNVWFVLSGSLAMGSALTNGMAAAASAVGRRGLRKGAVLVGVAFVVVMLGWCAQRVIFPKPAAFPFRTFSSELQFTSHSDQGGPLRAGIVLVGASVVAPPAVQSPYVKNASPAGPMLSMQWSQPSEWSWLSWGALLGWAGLLIAGANAILTGRCRSAVWRVSLQILACQVAFHCWYGEETFLYVLHLSPLFVLVAGAGLLKTRSLGGRAAIVIALAFIGGNNLTRLHECASWPGTGRWDDRLNRLTASQNRRPPPASSGPLLANETAAAPPEL